METPAPTDDELALRSPTDPAAFEQLYGRYARRVFGLLKSMGLKGNGVDDIAQQAWLNVWKALPNKPPGAAVGPWLMVVARNAAIDEVRKKRLVSVPEEMQIAGGGYADVLADVEENAQMDRLRHCLDLLPEVEKRVVQNRLEGIDSPAIAGAIGLTSDRVHRLFHDAKKKLQVCLGSDRT